jgi:short/branched chain acyl-CoA dehydrogenase
MLGLAQGALNSTLPYLYQRKQFGQPIGHFQGMQFQVAQCASGEFSWNFLNLDRN